MPWLKLRYFEVELTEHSDPKYYRWHVASDGKNAGNFHWLKYDAFKVYIYIIMYIYNNPGLPPPLK